MAPSRPEPETVCRARALLGTRFKLQGRSPRFGLDCVGLVACALGEQAAALVATKPAGREAAHRHELKQAMSTLGWVETDAAVEGCVAEFDVGGHLHLGILTRAGVIHAHAGLRRVVEGAVPDHWRRVSTWRRAGDA